MNEYRQLTYSENGAWGLKGANLLQCPPRIYGACAKLCDMEKLCVEVAEARDVHATLDALQELMDKGLGGRFVDLHDILINGEPT